jgi:hypothetical protein
LLHVESPPLARVMTPLEVVKDIGPGLGSGPVVLSVHPLTFEHTKEALGHGVVGAAAHRTHAAGHLVRLQKPLVFLGGKLTAPIRVQNDRGPCGPLPQGHQHRLDHQLAVLTRTHRPAHHEARIHIQHDAQVQLLFGRANVGDIRDPFRIGGHGAEVPLQMIAGRSRAWA